MMQSTKSATQAPPKPDKETSPVKLPERPKVPVQVPEPVRRERQMPGETPGTPPEGPCEI